MKRILKKYMALIKEGSSYGDDEDVKTWNKDERDAAFAYAKSEGVNVMNYGNMQFPCYSLVKKTEYKQQGEIFIDRNYYIRGFAFKEDTIKKYNLTEIDDYCDKKSLWSIYSMLNEFDIPYISIRIAGGIVKHYTDFEKFKKLVEEVNVKQQPLVIEGTDWPYWFNFKSKLIPSKTSNWFKYLQTKFNYIAPASLVPYAGEDMCDKHLFDKN